MKLRLFWISALVLSLICLGMLASVWSASSELLFPAWRNASKNWSVCDPETEIHWGKRCGNLLQTREFRFEEVTVPSLNGIELPGWLVRTEENGGGKSQGAILFVHGGGSDRREMTRYIRFFLDIHLDVLSVDLGCHGQAPCVIPGLTYGERESRDVVSIYLYLSRKYSKVYALGSSVGASSILIALPEMPELSGVIAENPMFDFRRLILETSSAPKFIPEWFKKFLLEVSMVRGKFDGISSPANSLRMPGKIPVFFIHSKEDKIVPYRHTEELATLYKGPKTVWLLEKGEHGSVWEKNPNEYRNRVRNFLQRKSPSGN
ncbi:alpha/beta hydrolase [Leptospira fletcheri]|uniref:Alpha/beta hydrolase n=1 Tax=Leptospira fletcheri TaxID=2484981 RepID=A0A4R9GFT8_9LEPT|nr:prolyl oligopeptidase family serine peptidase [Leptospira fletcheri]TGK10037.1 alpha/beta hydrolase [Leptospira fletcheri]